jgi:hypothetical protein
MSALALSQLATTRHTDAALPLTPRKKVEQTTLTPPESGNITIPSRFITLPPDPRRTSAERTNPPKPENPVEIGENQRYLREFPSICDPKLHPPKSPSFKVR